MRVSRLCYDSSASALLTGTADGALKTYDTHTFELRTEFPALDEKHTFFNHPSAAAYGGLISTFGVTDIVVSGSNVYACGSDGSVKFIKKKTHRTAPVPAAARPKH